MRVLPPLFAAALAALPVSAQPASPPPPSAKAETLDEAKLRQEIEAELAKDAKSGASKSQGQRASDTSGTASTQANGSPASPPVLSSSSAGSAPQAARARGGQSLNPDISAILDFDGGYVRRAPTLLNGDDPDLIKSRDPRKPAAGFIAQEVEIAASAIVDPYLKGEVYLTIPNLEGIEVEEAFATSTSLPGNFQVKAGSFRGAFGRQNGQHLHLQDFTRRPLINAAFLGQDGMRGPGLQVSWLAPTDFFLTVTGEAFSLKAPDAPGAAPASFGGGAGTDLTYALEAKTFAEAAEDISVSFGLNSALGQAPVLSTDPASPGFASGLGRRSELFGSDLYVKWKPINVTGGYQSLAWQTEAMVRHLEAGAGAPAEWDAGAYSQLVYQLSRRWVVGVRGDLISYGVAGDAPSSSAARASTSLTFVASEFARVRGYLEAEHATLGAPEQKDSVGAFAQLEISIGAHGAHPF